MSPDNLHVDVQGEEAARIAGYGRASGGARAGESAVEDAAVTAEPGDIAAAPGADSSAGARVPAIADTTPGRGPVA